MLFTATAALRILAEAAKKVTEVRVLSNVVLVRFVSQDGNKCATFVSKAAFANEFKNFRQVRGAAAAAAGKVAETETAWLVQGSRGDVYEVSLTETAVECGCEDRHYQQQSFGRGVCVHGYAVLATLGYSSLSSYVAAQQRLTAALAA